MLGWNEITTDPGAEQLRGDPFTADIVRLVRDNGEQFFRGDRVRLHRTLSTPQELHAVCDAGGRYEVRGCTRVPAGHKRLLHLVLREITPT
jgi:hypothetical protein